jgi:hypothetical protein
MHFATIVASLLNVADHGRIKPQALTAYRTAKESPFLPGRG